MLKKWGDRIQGPALQDQNLGHLLDQGRIPERKDTGKSGLYLQSSNISREHIREVVYLYDIKVVLKSKQTPHYLPYFPTPIFLTAYLTPLTTPVLSLLQRLSNHFQVSS